MSRVLIAEDDPDLAAVLQQALSERLGVVADVVANGALVMDSIGTLRPDLLILDVSLPGLNGLDVFALVRGDEHARAVPVVFLTALPDRAATASAGIGVQEVVAKPFDLDDLISRARRLIGAAHAEVAA